MTGLVYLVATTWAGLMAGAAVSFRSPLAWLWAVVLTADALFIAEEMYADDVRERSRRRR